mgnify:CR=1 FL=1
MCIRDSIVAGTHTLERYRSQLLIQWRSFTVDVEVDHRPKAADDLES